MGIYIEGYVALGQQVLWVGLTQSCLALKLPASMGRPLLLPPGQSGTLIPFLWLLGPPALHS